MIAVRIAIGDYWQKTIEIFIDCYREAETFEI